MLMNNTYDNILPKRGVQNKKTIPLKINKLRPEGARWVPKFSNLTPLMEYFRFVLR
jgi:hypothetical protein